MEFDLLTYIGRFQPFHRGHKAVVDEALKRAERVAIGLGSHDRPRDVRNPWSTYERTKMIRDCFTSREQDRLIFVPLIDHTYNLSRWLGSVESAVYQAAFQVWQPGAYRIGIIGFDKDETSFYLRHFPQWNRVLFKPSEIIDATSIRNDYFGYEAIQRTLVTDPVADWLHEWIKTEDFYELATEYQYLKHYKEEWGTGPFMTADMCVVQAGHVLLIERGQEYGTGLLALPGGFVGIKENVADAAIRELYEETGLKVNENIIRKQVERQVPRLFDDPLRSRRGRIYTHCYRIDLDFPELPTVKGSDDAAAAMWVPPGQIKRNEFFEDHFCILEAMGVL